MRQLSAVQLAALAALVASLLAVFVPTFMKNLHASRLAEPLDGLQRIAAGATRLAAGEPPLLAYPESVARTPQDVPAGQAVVDEPGTWDVPTWQLLGFRIDEAHYFSFDFEREVGQGRAVFTAGASGDLDGDGELSRFEIVGEARAGKQPRVFPIQIHREVE